MSADSSTSQRAPGFLWILAAFLGFALLTFVFQGWFGQDRTDPREGDRLANLADIKTIQAANVKKLGVEVGKSDERLAKALEALKALKPTTSAMLVPGSPTQLKQSAAPAPAPAAPAPGAAAKPAETPAAATPAPAPAAKPAEAPPAAAPAPAPAK